MSDPYAADDQDRQFLWICFLSLFIVLFSCSLVVLLSRVCCFCERYCICQWKWCGCCCVVDVEAYRRERQHLHRLRELRQQRDVEIAHLATFTQIPGPIPDSYGFRELRRQTAIRDLTSLGFIVVTPQGAHSSASQNDVNSLEMRNHLSTEQRRDILDRLLSCRTYHVEELDSVQHGKTDDNTDENDMEEGNTKETPVIHDPEPVQSYAFPLHEEPEELEKTCAICLDDFAEGEIINDNSKCPHVFHKACLIEWLDMHDVCPCCRCTMITDSEWRHAAAHTSDVEAATNDVDRRPTRDAEEMVETVEEESNGLEVNESSNEQGQVAVSITPVLTTNDGMEDPRAVESA